jgi:1,4-alpha-glucan branching enzyme
MKKPVSPLPLITDDPWLSPYEADLQERNMRFQEAKQGIEKEFGSLLDYAQAYRYLGINYDADKGGWWYREWAPGAHALFLIGDFNHWDRSTHPLTRNESGIWEIFLPDSRYGDSFTSGSLLKVHVQGANGNLDRIPPYIFRAVQNPQTYDFIGQVWQFAPFPWQDQDFHLGAIEEPVIYECHVGMAQEKAGIGTFREFTDKVLPRIHAGGYNTIQLMAVQEHPYYGSFGYHVSNFFAVSSRFGTPEELKALVNRAHQLGIAVIMDLVHSHAVKNVPGPQGYHPAWDSRVFDYGKKEVRQFLLSNVRYWLEEFHFDGFRFDGVTSMLYQHHGEGVAFDHYDRYFRQGVDKDAITYQESIRMPLPTFNWPPPWPSR